MRDNAEQVLPNKAESIVVYGSDATCPSCAEAVETLEALGYQDLTWFRAGKRGWEERGYSMEGEA